MANKNAALPTQGLSAGNKAVDPVVNNDGVVFAVASRAAAAYSSNAYANPNRLGVRLFINLTVVNGGTLTVKVQNFDPASQTWVDIPGAVTSALAAVLVTELTIYPGVTETLANAAGTTVSRPVGDLFRIVATTATAAVTFGIGGEYIG